MKKQIDDERGTFLLNIGNHLHKRRIQLGLSQEDLAYKAHIDRSYISGIERGKRNISIYTLKKITDSLNMNIIDVFEKGKTR
ncbi:MAG: helix-turn-helix transcriptional regulator [Ignavibacteria bacterium]|nr:helix-turn-helix transcriptional regulator [Ignavibacteria bacterium]